MSTLTRLAINTTYLQHGEVAPEVDPDSAWWWEALAAGRLELPHCCDCDRFHFPPTPRCANCGSSRIKREVVSPDGRIYSWVVVHHAQDPAFVDDTPYTIVAVHLDVGPRLFGRLLSGKPRPDMRVTATTYRVGENTLLGFDLELAQGR